METADTESVIPRFSVSEMVVALDLISIEATAQAMFAVVYDCTSFPVVKGPSVEKAFPTFDPATFVATLDRIVCPPVAEGAVLVLLATSEIAQLFAVPMFIVAVAVVLEPEPVIVFPLGEVVSTPDNSINDVLPSVQLVVNVIVCNAVDVGTKYHNSALGVVAPESTPDVIVSPTLLETAVVSALVLHVTAATMRVSVIDAGVMVSVGLTAENLVIVAELT